MMTSLLHKANKQKVCAEPFPHIVLTDALPKEYCNSLIQSYPPIERLSGQKQEENNCRYDYTTAQVLQDALIPQEWKEFVAYHASPQFFHEIVELFGDHIIRLHPRAFPTIAALKQLRIGIRNLHDFTGYDVLLDAQISGNTPVQMPSSVRPVHIDSPKKLVAGLFYLRLDDDTSEGGDLTLCRLKNKRFTFGDYLSVKDADVEVWKTVRYESNVLVMFVNTLEALHGVSIRQPTRYPRIFFNFIAELENKVFHIPERHLPSKGRVKRTLKRIRQAWSER